MFHALPGLCADRRMFPPPWSSLPDFVADDWTPFAREQSLAAVAQSMCAAHNIRDGDSLIGASLGGMVGCEITKIRKIKALYLVGSAVQKEEISAVFKMFHPFAKVIPISLLQFFAKKIPNELAQMFAASEASFIRAMTFAIFRWQGLENSATKIYRLHGKQDLIIPPPKKTHLFLNGGHFISMTHSKECVEYIGQQLQN
jgi:hypothetical protein